MHFLLLIAIGKQHLFHVTEKSIVFTLEIANANLFISLNKKV